MSKTHHGDKFSPKSAVGTLGGAAGAGEARQRAEVEGATPEEKATATALGVIPGLLEIVPAQYLLNRVFRPAAEIAKTQPQIIQRLKDLAVTAGIEGAQEAAQEFAQNLIAQGVYKPDQELIEGVGESTALIVKIFSGWRGCDC